MFKILIIIIIVRFNIITTKFIIKSKIDFNPKLEMNQDAHKYRIHLFALCYLVSTVSYGAITSMTYSLYNRYGLANLALVGGIFGFIGFGPTNMIVLHLLRKLNLRNGLALGFTGMMLYEITVLLTVISADKQIPVLSSMPIIYMLNIVFSFIAGMSNSIIWTVMPTYTQAHCDQIQPFRLSSNPDAHENKNSITAFIGLFWSIYMWSFIIGGLLNIFVLGYASQYVYMITIIAIAGLSIAMVIMFVHPFEVSKLRNREQDQGMRSAIKNQIVNLVDIIKDQRSVNRGTPNIFVFSLIAGLYLGFYPIFINKLIQKSLPIEIHQQQFSRLTAIVFMFQGVGSIVTGVIQSKLYYLISQNKQKSLQWGISLVQGIMFMTMYAYNGYQHTGDSYWVNILIMFGWSCTKTHIMTNMEAYNRQYNGGKVQFYSLSILFYSAGSMLGYLIQMIHDPNSQMIVLMFVGVFFICVWIIRQPDIQYLNKKAGNLDIELRLIEKKQNREQY